MTTTNKLRFTKPDGTPYPEWTETTLGEVCEINSEQLSSDDNIDVFEYADISSVGTGILKETELYNINEAPSRARRIVREGDTVISTVRVYNKSYLYITKDIENKIFSTGFAVVRPQKNSIGKYLYYVISNDISIDYLNNISTGSNYPAFNSSQLKSLPIILPCLEEQERIASLLSTVDEMIDTKSQELDLRRTYKQAMMQRLFSQEVRFKQADGTPYPDWTETTLGAVCEIKGGERITQREHLGTKYPVYGGGSISFYTNNYNQENKLVISRFAISESCVRKIQGKFWLLDSGLTFNVINNDNESFLNYVIFQLEKDIYNSARGVAQKNVDMNILRTLPIILPCLEEQERIASLLSTVDEQVDTTQNELHALQQHKKALMQRVL